MFLKRTIFVLVLLLAGYLMSLLELSEGLTFILSMVSGGIISSFYYNVFELRR